MKNEKMVKVIGLGNRLRGDDAIGPAVIDELTKRNQSPGLQLVDAGADAFTLLEHLIEENPVIVVDCAKMNSVPGDIRMINDREIEEAVTEGSVSLHGFSLAEVIRLARQTGEVAPFSVIGIEPESIEFNSGLSQTVLDRIPDIINLIMQEVNKYEQENIDH